MKKLIIILLTMLMFCSPALAKDYRFPNKAESEAIVWSLEETMRNFHEYMNETDLIYGNMTQVMVIRLTADVLGQGSYKQSAAAFAEHTFNFAYMYQGSTFKWLELPYFDFDNMQISCKIYLKLNSARYVGY